MDGRVHLTEKGRVEVVSVDHLADLNRSEPVVGRQGHMSDVYLGLSAAQDNQCTASRVGADADDGDLLGVAKPAGLERRVVLSRVTADELAGDMQGGLLVASEVLGLDLILKEQAVVQGTAGLSLRHMRSR